MFPTDPFQLNFETIVAASPMLGHRLECRESIRRQQDLSLLERWQESSTLPLRSAAQQDQFVVAPLDILVSRQGDGVHFHIIELNGTGIGGVSNLPAVVVSQIAASLRRVAQRCWAAEGVLLLPVSGKECQQSPRLNKLMHEKLIFAEAMQAGLAAGGGQADIVTLSALQDGSQRYRAGAATVVMGYIKDLMNACTVDATGQVQLLGRRVVGAVNDRFCLNLFSLWGDQIDRSQFAAINGTYIAGGDKGVAYSLLDEYLVHQPHASFPARVNYAHAHRRNELITTVLQWLSIGRRVVIKPHGTGIGHGIEFFLDAGESTGSVIERIDQSLRITEEYYAIRGGAFPYTICEYVESDWIRQAGHRLQSHKYELRVVVYRDGLSLKACPTIAKVACQPYDSQSHCRDSLINNITNASVSRQSDGSEFMLPLCCDRTLQTLGLTVQQMESLCQVATNYVRHTIDEVGHLPERLAGKYGNSWADLESTPPQAVLLRQSA